MRKRAKTWSRRKRDARPPLIEYFSVAQSLSPARETYPYLRQRKAYRRVRPPERSAGGWRGGQRERTDLLLDSFLSATGRTDGLITNYFISRSSSGWVEGLNNKIKVLKRRSYGIKNLANLFRRLWLDLNGYEAFAH
ncbi:MAG: transposase [Blastocatellales bacterium]|nr:transposase [Blastocatellales bacterium]